MKRITFSIIAAGLVAGFATLGPQSASPVQAQGMSCNDINPMLEQRSSLVERVNALGTEDVDPRQACPVFRDLVANGEEVKEFVEENQAWCQIPQSFVDGFMQDHEQVTSVRDQACQAAAQINRLENEARQQQEQGQFGGPGLTGRFPIPQGAL
ncbi:MAG: hypothetical protein ACXIVD_06145 [Salinarimonas sp.]